MGFLFGRVGVEFGSATRDFAYAKYRRS